MASQHRALSGVDGWCKAKHVDLPQTGNLPAKGSTMMEWVCGRGLTVHSRPLALYWMDSTPFHNHSPMYRPFSATVLKSIPNFTQRTFTSTAIKMGVDVRKCIFLCFGAGGGARAVGGMVGANDGGRVNDGNHALETGLARVYEASRAYEQRPSPPVTARTSLSLGKSPCPSL